MNEMMKTTERNEVIPLFFAVDDAYVPPLCVALQSIREHIRPDRRYGVYILSETVTEAHRRSVLQMQSPNMSVSFVSVKEKMRKGGSRFHLRDYYSKATYYRFFIPELFPEFDKGIYLDCDTIVLTDPFDLYSLPLGNCPLAAAPEEVMLRYPVFGKYTETVLDVPRERYFSAGVLLMNLKMMREERLEQAFLRLLEKKTYRVTQDQDYLNVLYKDRVLLLETTWNHTAFPDADPAARPHIVHFKMAWKPWHAPGVTYAPLFWKYASGTPFYRDLLAQAEKYTPAVAAEDLAQFDALSALAESETAAEEKAKKAYVQCAKRNKTLLLCASMLTHQ